jgi:hypothetical protein
MRRLTATTSTSTSTAAGLVHVERIGGLLPDVHAWADGLECNEGTRQAVTLPDLSWGDTTPAAADPQPFDSVTHTRISDAAET